METFYEQLKKSVYNRINCKDSEADYVKKCLRGFGIEIQWVDYFDEQSYKNFLRELVKARENYDPYAYARLLQAVAGVRNAAKLSSYLDAGYVYT